MWAHICHNTWVCMLLHSFLSFSGRSSSVVCHCVPGQLACKPSRASPMSTGECRHMSGFPWVLGV